MVSRQRKVAVITGASSGIGAETAKHFASLGYFLSLFGRNKENLEKVGKECETNGVPEDKVLLLQGDVTDDEYCRNAIAKTVEMFGQLDVLVNNAGIGDSNNFENSSLESYDIMMNTNLRAVFHLTMLATPHLIKTKGAIVNVSSVNSLVAFPISLTYNMAKRALDQMTNCVALELAPKGVRVNSVNPALIMTDIFIRQGFTEEGYAELLRKKKAIYPLGRVGVVEDVAKAIAFLASDEASFITATQLPVTGGRHAQCPR